jgi:ribosome assembly protein YihI (activator of Der GTPase)
MTTIPPDFLDSTEPQKHLYTLEQLLALCEAKTKLSQENQAWLDAPTIGNELL